MRLRTVIITVLAFSMLMQIAFMFIPFSLFTTAVHDTEIQHYSRMADMLAEIFNQKGALYGQQTDEWSTRESSYTRVLEKDNSIPRNSLKELDTQFIIFLGRDYVEKNSVYTFEGSKYSEEIIRVIKKHKSTIEKHIQTNAKYLILNMPASGKPLLLGISTVKEDIHKSAVGFIFMGHVIEQSFIEQLYSKFGFEANTARVNLNISPVYAKEETNTVNFVEMLSNDTAKISLVLKDQSGKSVLNIFFSQKRITNIETQEAIKGSATLLILFSILLFVIALAVLLKFIIRPAEELSSSIKTFESKNTNTDFPQHKPTEFEQIEATIREMAYKTEQMEKDIIEMSKTDQLTGIINKRFFDEILLFEWDLAKRAGGHLGLIIADLDDFKLYNDTYGYTAGDKCIAEVAEIIRKSLKRKTDIIARYGGEEFMVLLPDTELQGVKVVAEEIMSAVRAAAIPHAASSRNIVTLSMGYCSLVPEQDETKERLMLEADKALYEAKKNKNSIYPS